MALNHRAPACSAGSACTPCNRLLLNNHRPAPLQLNSPMTKPLAMLASAAIVLTPPAALAEVPSSIAACVPKTSCVSTSSFQSPSQYLPAWLHDAGTPTAAHRRLAEEVQALGATVVDSVQGSDTAYLRVYMPVGPAGAEDEEEFVFKENFVLFRSQARGVTAPDPPFCLTPGCINGPKQRQRMEALRDRLGWASLETDEDKAWVQIFLH